MSYIIVSDTDLDNAQVTANLLAQEYPNLKFEVIDASGLKDAFLETVQDASDTEAALATATRYIKTGRIDLALEQIERARNSAHHAGQEAQHYADALTAAQEAN